MGKKETNETTERLKKAIEQQEKESRVTPNSSVLDEIHKALCKLFDQKYHADWKLYEPPQSSRLAAMRSLTFDVYSLRDRILDLTQTEFDEKFSSLRNALGKVEDQLKMQSIQPFIKELDFDKYSGETPKDSFSDHEFNSSRFSHQFLKDTQTFTKIINLANEKRKKAPWRKNSVRRLPNVREREIALFVVEAYHEMLGSLPVSKMNNDESGTAFRTAMGAILKAINETALYKNSGQELSSEPKRACNDALTFYKQQLSSKAKL